MAKLRVKNLSKVRTDIRKRITKALRDKSIREGVGEIIVDDIQNNPVNTASQATQAWRKYYEPANKPLDPKYDIKDINFTFTGRLMKDLRENVKAQFNKGSVEYVLEHSNKKHPKYKKPKRKTRRKTSAKPAKSFTYKQLYEQIKSLNFSYDYLIFSNEAKRDVINFIKLKIRKLLKWLGIHGVCWQ